MENRFFCSGGICIKLNENDKKFAAIAENETFLWVKFILTDDKPNGNKDRIPREEFENVKKTAVFVPIKANFDQDSEEFLGHNGAVPVGVVTNVAIEEDRVIGLGIIWKEEFPKLAEVIKKKVSSGENVNLSWELYCEEEPDPEYEGVSRLKNVRITAVTIVGNPAYQGRTPIQKVSEEEEWRLYWEEYEEFYQKVAEKWSRAYINDLPDCAFLYIEPGGEKDEEGKTKPRYLRHLPVKNHKCEIDLPHLRNAIARLSQEKTGTKGGRKWLTEGLRKRLLEEARRMLEEYNKKKKSQEEEVAMQDKDLQARLEQLQKENEMLKEKLRKYEEELKELRAFKQKVDAEIERQRRLSEIKQMFEESGLERDEEYFEKNADKLLAMDKDALEFFIQELKAFAESKEDQKEAEMKEEDAPNFVAPGDEDLVAAIRALIRKEREK